MLVELILLAVVVYLVVAAVTSGGAADSNFAKPPPSPPTNVFPLPRDPYVENALVLWNDTWQITKESGSFAFQVWQIGSEGDGLIVALANEWKEATSGGIALVLSELFDAPFADDEYATEARTRSYFATMPYYFRPAPQSTTLLNHRVVPENVYELSWTPEMIALSLRGASVPLLAYDRTAMPSDSARIRYLAFGTYGVARSADCANKRQPAIVKIL